LLPDSWRRRGHPVRWSAYLVAGAAAAATLGPWLVVVLVGCGLIELAIRRSSASPATSAVVPWWLTSAAAPAVAAGGLLSLGWVALKVGALSYGGGFVIIPLMQNDAVHRYHWMTAAQFLNAVALGQVTPGPVVQTVAVVGYAAAGIGGGVLAAAIAFAPSFVFVLVGGRHFDQIRRNPSPRAFLSGAGPAAIGGIMGSAIPLTRALSEPWQYGVLAAAAVLLIGLRRGVVTTILGAALVGLLIGVAGGPLP
jgi:chromate transporter